MALKKTFLRKLNTVLRYGGFELIHSRHFRSSQEYAFRSIAERHPNLLTVIDIGASDGRWSKALMRHLPTARYLLVEAQTAHREGLKGLCKQIPTCEYILAAAGEQPGEIYFDASDPFGGQASSVKRPDDILVPVTTIDHEVYTHSLAGPILLKFDTHGFELPILRGAVKTLENTEVIVMECYNFRIADEALIFYEMCEHLGTLGFRPIDFFDPIHRPHDGCFWQCDIVFARAERPEFGYTQFR
jgi:FkbM family methyltransferase